MGYFIDGRHYDEYDGTTVEWDDEDNKAYIRATMNVPDMFPIDLKGFSHGWSAAMSYMMNRIGAKFDFPITGGFWNHVDKLKKGDD
jgi:hypothetical protein